MEGYLGKIRPFLPCMTDDLRISGAWKIYLTMKINFMSSNGYNEKRLVQSISNNDCKSQKLSLVMKQMKLLKNSFGHLFIGIQWV